MKILITIIISLATLNSFAQNLPDNDTIINNIVVKNKIELSNKERYAVNMLKKSYTVKSVMRKTNLPKSKVKELNHLIKKGKL
jgi:hypothetical protein